MAARRVSPPLSQIAPDVDLEDVDFTGAEDAAISPVRQLFVRRTHAGTLLLWLAFFMSLLVVYLLSNWMPTLIQRNRRLARAVPP